MACFRGNVNSAYCVTRMNKVYRGTMARMKDKSKRTNLHSAPHGSAGCRHRVYYHLLRRQVWAQKHIEPSPHLSKTHAVPPKCASTRGGFANKKRKKKKRNVCAIVITVCALINTTDCNWDATSTSFYEEEEAIGCYSTSATWTCYRLRLQRWRTVSH